MYILLYLYIHCVVVCVCMCICIPVYMHYILKHNTITFFFFFEDIIQSIILYFCKLKSNLKNFSSFSAAAAAHLNIPFSLGSHLPGKWKAEKGIFL